MKKLSNLLFFTCAGFFLGASYSVSAQSHISTQAHQEAINMVAPASTENDLDKSFFTIGKDGFLVKWTSDDQGEHYQISDMEIKMAAVSPNGKEIAVYETDGGSTNRISVWNWDTLSRKFARRFSDSITSISYSEKGTYIIVGTATVDGAVFLKAADGSVVDKIRDTTGIVSYAATSSTEKTAVMYSPAGSLSYYNLATGRMKQKFSVMQGLEQAVLFNSNLYLAGIKDNTIYVCHALSGNILRTEKTENAIILESKSDTSLYYLENDMKGTYTLKMLENDSNHGVTPPRIVKTYKGPRGNADAITCGSKIGQEILLGANSGNVYRATSTVETSAQNFSLLTENTYDKILDMSPIGEDFYFLTRKSVYKSSYDTGIVNRLGENPGQTQMITYGDKLILWSKGTREPVQLYDYSKPELKNLFTPRNSLQSVRLFGTQLIEIESNSIVNLFDMESGSLKEVYTGAGLQDAVICPDGKLYVAKSYATNPRSSLLCVDLTTRETVPMNLKGNVAFALSVQDNNIYGISIQSQDNIKRTSVFKFNIVSKMTTSILRLNDEDSGAFTYLKYPLLYTNIGKDSVRSCNLSTNTNFVLRRSASLPIKVCQNATRVVILNKDGSISWYNSDKAAVLADWYLTRDGNWFEF